MNLWLRKCEKCGGKTDFENCHICRENKLKEGKENERIRQTL